MHFRLRGILIKLLQMVSIVRHRDNTDQPHHARQQPVQCMLQAHLHVPQHLNCKTTQALEDRQHQRSTCCSQKLLSSSDMQQPLQAWQATTALHCSLGAQGVQLRQTHTLHTSLIMAAVRQHIHLTPSKAHTSAAAETSKDDQPRRAQTLLSSWARHPNTCITDLHCSRGIQGDPPEPGTNSAHIGVHWELRHGQAEQHDTGHAFAPQACSRPAQGLAGLSWGTCRPTLTLAGLYIHSTATNAGTQQMPNSEQQGRQGPLTK